MVHKMPRQLGSLKPRKRKSNSRKAPRRRCMKSPKTQPAAESSSAVSGYSKAPLERLSRIMCECQQSAGMRRCSASPELEGQEGKENELWTMLDLDSCRGDGVWDKQEFEDMDCEETSKNVFPDDDSNQILPVEQFFGNLDAVQFSSRLLSSISTGSKWSVHHSLPLGDYGATFCSPTKKLVSWRQGVWHGYLMDFPQKSSSAHAHVEHRRRYYAPEDSDEEEDGFSSMQPDDRGDT